jgi:hypothetical protein
MSTTPTKKASSFIHILTHPRAVRSNKQHAELYLSEKHNLCISVMIKSLIYNSEGAHVKVGDQKKTSN